MLNTTRLLSMLCLLASLALLAAGGCSKPWRPGAEQVVSATEEVPESTPANCLRASRAGHWTYERREVGDGHEEPANADLTYVRVIRDDLMYEGSPSIIADKQVHEAITVANAAAPASQPSQSQPAEETPRAKWKLFSIEIAEPMDPTPPELAELQQVTGSSKVSYGAIGDQSFWKQGTLTRKAVIEGFEDVDCPAGRFERCLRVRVDLTVRFPLTPVIDLTTYMWLSPVAGEVKRVQRFEGFILVFWFRSAHEYVLTAYERPAERLAQDVSRCWSRILMLLDRSVPHPRIGAFKATLASSQPAG